MPAEPPAGRSGLGLVFRGLGGLALAGFIALLVYGVLAQAPDATIDEALSSSEAVAAPGFELDPLQRGRPGALGSRWDRAAADNRVELDELEGTPVVVNFWASCVTPAAPRHQCWSAAGAVRASAACCSSGSTCRT